MRARARARSRAKVPSCSRALLGALPLVGLVASWVTLSEVVQGLTSSYPHLFFLVYCIRSSFAFALLPYAALCAARRGAARGAPLLPGPVPAAPMRAMDLLQPRNTARRSPPARQGCLPTCLMTADLQPALPRVPVSPEG